MILKMDCMVEKMKMYGYEAPSSEQLKIERRANAPKTSASTPLRPPVSAPKPPPAASASPSKVNRDPPGGAPLRLRQ